MITSIDVCPTEDVVEATNIQIKQDIRDLIRARFETCGGIGWRRFAYLNMTDSTMQCPPGFTEQATQRGPVGYNLVVGVTLLHSQTMEVNTAVFVAGLKDISTGNLKLSDMVEMTLNLSIWMVLV